MSGSSARLLIIIDAQDKSQAAFSGVENALKGLDTGSKGAGAALGSMVSQVATAGAVVGGVLATGIGAAVKQAADFEHGLSAVGAASGASASEMQGLHDTALALGASTQLAGINATDAAQAMTQLAKGGVSVADIMGGAANGALLLASAGEIGVGQAADIAVRAMTIFGAKGSDVAHISDLIAAAAGKSATDVGQLGAAFNQSAAVAANAGLSIEELTGTLGFLAQRGLEGSDAGTSLRTALQRLQSPTDTAAKTMADLGINVRDANGKMLPMAQVADILKERLGGLSDAQRDAALQTIFGADAIRVAIPLVQAGGSAITDWTAKVNDAGYAARQGAALNNNLAGSWDQFQATVQTAAIGIGEKFIPVLRKGSDELAKFVDSLASNKDVAKFFDDLAQKAATALDTIIAKVKDPTFQAQMRDWATTAKDLATSILDVAGAVKDTLGPPLKAAADWFGSLDDQGRKNVVMFGLVAGAAIHFRDELGTLKGVVEDVIGAFARKEAAKKSLQAANDGLAGSAGKTATAMSGAGAAALEAADLIATAGIATGGAAIGATALVVGYDKLTNAIGENNDIASQGALRQEAMAIALAHGASMQNGAIDGYLRLVLAQENTVHSTSDLDRIWNQFAGTLQATGQSTDTLGLSLINLNTPIGVMTGGLGLGRNEMQLFAQTGTIVNQSLTGLVSGATAVAAAMVPVSNTVSAADQAFGQVTLSARTMGEGVATAANSMAAVVTTTTTTFGPDRRGGGPRRRRGGRLQLLAGERARQPQRHGLGGAERADGALRGGQRAQGARRDRRHPARLPQAVAGPMGCPECRDGEWCARHRRSAGTVRGPRALHRVPERADRRQQGSDGHGDRGGDQELSGAAADRERLFRGGGGGGHGGGRERRGRDGGQGGGGGARHPDDGHRRLHDEHAGRGGRDGHDQHRDRHPAGRDGDRDHRRGRDVGVGEQLHDERQVRPGRVGHGLHHAGAR
jgi:TP901 family phage tail tape measure protein